jgi:hypothetical protein
MQKLAQGIDPITDTELADDTVLNNVRLSRCFTYVAELLQKVIESGGKGMGWQQRPFFITPEEIKRVPLNDQPISISAFIQAVSDAVGDPGRKKLSAVTVIKWLVDTGYLRVVQDNDKKTHKELTEKSTKIGMSTDERVGPSGPYTAILYDKTAQQFILENLPAITELTSKE